MTIKTLSFLEYPLWQYVVYISGKITGDYFYETKFICKEAYLKQLGFHYIINPVKLVKESGVDISNYELCMDVCLSKLNAIKIYKQKVIFLRLEDWIDSPGAKRENWLAKGNGFIICDLIGGEIKLAENDNRFLRENK